MIDVHAPRTREQLRAWVLHDLAAHRLSEWRDEYGTSRPVVHYQLLRRRAEYWTYGTDHPVPAGISARRSSWLRARTQRLGRSLQLDVPLGTSGPGLLLVPAPSDLSSRGHQGIWVHPATRLGTDCTLHAEVVVDCEPATGKPSRLGNHCVLGERARVIGSRVGDRVEVAADALVEHNWGDDVRVGGNPARILDSTLGATTRRDGRRTDLTTDQCAAARRMQEEG